MRQQGVQSQISLLLCVNGCIMIIINILSGLIILF